MDFERKQNESQLDFHKRIIYGKLVDKTLSDIDYSELSELAYGQTYSSDVARRMFYGSRKTLDLLDGAECNAPSDKTNASSGVFTEVDQKIIELRKERQKFFDQRAAFNKIIRERTRQEELNEIIVDAVKN